MFFLTRSVVVYNHSIIPFEATNGPLQSLSLFFLGQTMALNRPISEFCFRQAMALCKSLSVFLLRLGEQWPFSIPFNCFCVCFRWAMAPFNLSQCSVLGQTMALNRSISEFCFRQAMTLCKSLLVFLLRRAMTLFNPFQLFLCAF